MISNILTMQTNFEVSANYLFVILRQYAEGHYDKVKVSLISITSY